MKKTVRAHTNIALIKYWGKRDEELILPMNSSLSLTLDAFYTDTSVRFDETKTEDEFYLNDVQQTGSSLKKVQVILDLVRQQSGISHKAVVESQNHVPTAAGLASSASGMAALAGAASAAAGLELSRKDLSRLARRGSGSASRSVYGGFVEWQKGTNDLDSHAVPVDDADWDIGMLFILLNKKEKAVSSREGMKRTVETSPFYPSWVESTEQDLIQMKDAIQNRDFDTIGKLTERSALKMHATTLGAVEPFTYWEPDSLVAMELVRTLRSEGFHCYFTMDAGPNVKVLCRMSEAKELQRRLASRFGEDNVLLSGIGEGLKELS